MLVYLKHLDSMGDQKFIIAVLDSTHLLIKNSEVSSLLFLFSLALFRSLISHHFSSLLLLSLLLLSLLLLSFLSSLSSFSLFSPCSFRNFVVVLV